MKIITISFILLALSSCNSHQATATEKQSENNINLTNFQEIIEVENIIENNNIFENSAESNLSLLSCLYQLGEVKTYNEIYRTEYILTPLSKTWSEKTSLDYTSNTKDGSIIFKELSISINPECLRKLQDLIRLMQARLGNATFDIEWDPEFGAESTWEYPSKDVDSENVVIIQSTPNNHRISIQNRPAPTEPF